MRKDFVSHDGKEEIFTQDDILAGEILLKDWTTIINIFCDKIPNNEWIEPNFTTTTTNDILIAKVELMGIMK